MPESPLALRGRFVHGVASRSGGADQLSCDLQLVDDGLVVVGDDGRITHFVTSTDDVDELLDGAPDIARAVIQMEPHEFCVPGLIDLHVHAPQYQFTGTATDLPLLKWLKAYVFPAERRCSDVDLARQLYDSLVARLLSHGTTTAVYFASIHLEATKVLVDVCRSRGQRAFVGKVAMDQHGGEGYQETTEEALRDTEALIHYCHEREPGHGDGATRLVNPVVTPRFIPSCSLPLLKGLGELAAKHASRGVWVQSHIAETYDEMAFVDSLHPGRRDAEIFDELGLLTCRCVMAHGVHLERGEMDLLARRRSGVACCPISNSMFSAGEFQMVEAVSRGVRVGLGTDIAGGYSPSLLVNGRLAVLASKVLARENERAEIGFKAAFCTATIGGARALGLEDHLGSFAVGKQFDALVVSGTAGVYETMVLDTRAHCAHEAVGKDGWAGHTPTSTLAAEFERWFNLGDDRNCKKVYVRGRAVHESKL